MSDGVSHVVEGYLLEGLRSAFHSVVEWFQDREHGLHIVLPKVHPGRERERGRGEGQPIIIKQCLESQRKNRRHFINGSR